jgi:FMN reductase
LSAAVVVSVVGNPRPQSRTHRIARELAAAIGDALGTKYAAEVDLSALGPAVLDPSHSRAGAAVEQVLRADVLVLASPTYKATYTGLLKAFLDRIGTGALRNTTAVPVLLGGAPNHQLAVDVHFTPLLLELGAVVPARGLFVLESEVEQFADRAATWAHENGPALVGAQCLIELTEIVTEAPATIRGQPRLQARGSNRT